MKNNLTFDWLSHYNHFFKHYSSQKLSNIILIALFIYFLNICAFLKVFFDVDHFLNNFMSISFLEIYLLFIYLIYFWLHWVLVAACGLLFSCGVWIFSSLVVAQVPERVSSVVCGTQALSLRHASSVGVARGLSCPTACGILVS